MHGIPHTAVQVCHALASRLVATGHVFWTYFHLLLPQNGSYEFSNARAAMVSPLAKKLFCIDGITGEPGPADRMG
jgi:hypothetical protein